MKVKTLRFKDTKEFVHILEGGKVGTSSIPDVLPMTASIDLLKKYYDILDPVVEMDFDNLEVVEYEFVETNEVRADIQNKLSPPLNLVGMLESYFEVHDPQITEERTKLVKFIKREMDQTLESINYLVNLFDNKEEDGQ